MEAGNKYFHEVVHLLTAARFKRRFQSRFCQQEFIISGREFFQTFQICTQCICLFHQRFFFIAICMLVNSRRKDIPQLFRNHIDQFLLSDFFNSLVLLSDLRIEVFHRSREIAGEHF